MEQQLQQFIIFLKQQNTYSEHSIKGYHQDLKKWLLFCQSQQLHHWGQLQKAQIQHYIILLKSSAISVNSMHRYLSSLRLFFDYLLKQKQLKDNVALQIRLPKRKRKLPRTLSFEEIQALLIDKNGQKNYLRDALIVTLLYSSALRISELVGLNREDIDKKNGFIKVLGKGNKERYTPVGKKAVIQISQYLNSRIDKNPALFINQKQTRISVRGVQNILANLAKRSTLGKHLHAHMLRHSSASHFLQSSENLKIVQDFLGHKNISSTQYYTHLDYQYLAKIYDKTHPRSHK